MKLEPGRWPLWRLAIREGWRDMIASMRQLGHPMRGRSRPPTRLLFAPQDLRTADPTVAQDIYGGYFVFAGRTVQTGGSSPFTAEAPCPAWTEALYGFGWLRHLRAADTPLARENARALLTEAMAARDRSARPEARTIPVVTRRLISFLCQSPLLLTGADHDFYRRLMRSIGLAVRELERGLVRAPRPLDRLLSAIGLCYAGLCCEGYEPKLRRAIAALSAELDAQILPDGGHCGRNPGTIIDLLLDLLPLRQVFTSRGVEPPEALERAVQRMLPMLRLFRHGDGTLALFNGMGRSALDHLATLVSYDSVRGSPAQHASYSGYDRVELGGTLLVADFGAPPPIESSAEAHAGCLSFELSAGLDRLVINCGTTLLDGALRQAARATAAHSTLHLDNASSAVVLDAEPRARAPVARWLRARLGPIMIMGPGKVEAERHTAADGSVQLVGRHDGYLSRFGYIHERRMRLTADGSRLEGEDRLTTLAGDRPERSPTARLCFHLHPGVEAQLTENGGGVLLRVGRSGDETARWRFTFQAPAGAGPMPGGIALEDSVYFADADGRRATRQIVVSPGLDASGGPAAVAWSFERLPT